MNKNQYTASPTPGDAFYGGNGVFGKIDMPLGLGMALAADLDAMSVFSAMSESRKRELINGARQIRSKQEMHDYVAMIAGGGGFNRS